MAKHFEVIIWRSLRDALTCEALLDAFLQVLAPQALCDWATALIGWVLQGGVLVSAAVMLVGMALLPTRPGGLSPQRLLVFPFTWSQLVADLAQFHPQGIITLGLLGLVATPVLSVAVSIVTFVRGATWKPTTIREKTDRWAWCLWEARLSLPAGECQIIVRAWDAAGQTQPEDMRPLWNFKGYANNAWHQVRVHLV